MAQRPRAKKGAGRSFWVLQNGWAIREIRELKDWSVSAFASRIDISPGTLSNIEAERRSASPDMLARIAEALGVAIEAITREKHEENPLTPPDPPPSLLALADAAV